MTTRTKRLLAARAPGARGVRAAPPPGRAGSAPSGPAPARHKARAPLARPPAGPYLTATLTQQSPWPAMAGAGARVGDPGPRSGGRRAPGGGGRAAPQRGRPGARAHTSRPRAPPTSLPPARTAARTKGAGAVPGQAPPRAGAPAPPRAPPSALTTNRGLGPAAGAGLEPLKTASWRASHPCVCGAGGWGSAARVGGLGGGPTRGDPPAAREPRLRGDTASQMRKLGRREGSTQGHSELVAEHG